MATTVPTNNNVLVTPREAELARDVLHELHTPDGFLSVGNEQRDAGPVPDQIGRLLQHDHESNAAGQADTVTSTAAAVLGVSRPTLMRFIAVGQLPAQKVGSHHRLKTADVLEFQRQRRSEARAAFEAMRDELD